MNPIKSLCAGMLGLMVGVCLTNADVVVSTSGSTQTGVVVRVESDGSIQFRTGMGEIKIPKSDVRRIDVPKPAAYDTAVAALKDGKYREAVAGLGPLVDQYAGLNIAWVQEAMLELGDAQLGAKAITPATQVFERFKKLYPQSPLAEGLDVKAARVLVAQGNCVEADKKLTALVNTMQKKDFLTDVQETIVAEALVVQGDCLAAAGKTNDALDCYLKVITLFDLNADITAEARYKAALAFEKLGNWKRAKGTFEDLLKDEPKADFVADAKQRLAAITKDHPE